VLVISYGEQQVSHKAIAAFFGVGKKKVRLAPPQQVLQLVGYSAGGVPPFGHRTVVRTLIDASLVARVGQDIVYAGGGDDVTMLEVTVAELSRVTEATPLDLG